MQWRVIDSDEALEQLVERERDCKMVAVDTEFMRRDTYYPQVALVQRCFEADRGMAWLVDPLRVVDTSPLAALLRDDDVI
ncbi:MAG: ribonuclease D, partial [Halioglobus sp.]|nr:ribonuclease D [Halioglobus sp.]